VARNLKIRRIVVCGVGLIVVVVGWSLLRDYWNTNECEAGGGRWNPIDARCERSLTPLNASEGVRGLEN
jgi:hypothetical protein